VFELAVNISQGRNIELIKLIYARLKSNILDLHSDYYHNRTVVTLVDDQSFNALKNLAEICFSKLSITEHQGIHPKLGVLDVVPFVPLPITKDPDLSSAIKARNMFAQYLAETYNVPVFLYGPEISLPEIRRKAFKERNPDFGPLVPHEQFGSTCVGARSVLVAYNILTSEITINVAKDYCKNLRSDKVRSLAFLVGDFIQFSFNLLNPFVVGPLDVYKRVSEVAQVRQSELVGLIPEKVLSQISQQFWNCLDLSLEKTIEARLSWIGKT
jgi:glutamate formiminotransferase